MQFSTTNGIRLYYCLDTNPGYDLPSNQVWERVPITSEGFSSTRESIDTNPLSSVSGTYGTSTASIKVSGTLQQELELSQFFINALISILGSDATQTFPHSTISGLSITNKSQNKRLAFLKVVETDDTLDYYLYRGCQLSSITVDISYGIPSASYSLEVSSLGNPSQTIPHYLDIDSSNLPSEINSWQFNDNQSIPSNVEILSNISISETVSFSDFSFTINRELEIKKLLGQNAFSSMITRRKIFAEVSGSLYFQHPRLYNKLLNDEAFQISFTLTDSHSSLDFTLPTNKATEISEPVAGSVDADLLVGATFSAEQRSATPLLTIEVTP